MSVIIGFIIWAGIFGFSTEFVAEYSMAELQQEVMSLKAEVAKMHTAFQLLETQMNATSDLAAKAAAAPTSPPVAFTARLTTTIQSIQEHRHVPFDDVITNVGGAYDKTTGHFTAPVFGLYSFTLAVTNTPGYSSSLTLMHNGNDVAHALAHGTSSTPSQWETSTVTAALVLNQGDGVWAQNEANFSPTENLDGYGYSSLTGHLIARL